jgi:hypothetical protein
MALDAGFVVAVLEGIEGTLDEVIERVDHAELKASLDVLQTRVTALRVSIEPPASEPEGNEESRRPRRSGIGCYFCYPRRSARRANSII